MASNTFLIERLAEKKRQLAIYDAAIQAISAGIESYDLDTGQSRQRVTRSNVKEYQDVICMLEDEICTLENRLNGNGGVTYARPIA